MKFKVGDKVRVKNKTVFKDDISFNFKGFESYIVKVAFDYYHIKGCHFIKFKDDDLEKIEDERRFIVPLPELVTTDGKQQYLTHKDCKFFASRRDATLIQTWEEEQLKFIPDVYRQFAVEFDEGKEY